jgi:uncharacterized protein (DUF433 family)
MSNTKNHPAEEASVTSQEAAWITGLSARTINATIDRGEVRPVGVARRRGVTSRKLGAAEVVYLIVRKRVGRSLSPQARRELYAKLLEQRRAAGDSPDADIELAGGLVRVEVKQAADEMAERWAALQDAAELVVSDPEIRGGDPVLRGTRVPVYVIADLVAQGADTRELLEDYPSLDTEMIQAALAYAETNPRRGRPAKAPWRDRPSARRRRGR